MELFRVLLLLILSVPPIDDVLPATPFVAKARTLLVRPGISPERTKRSLGLQKYQWSGSVFTGDWWCSSYLAPSGDHTVTVEYLLDRRTCELRLDKIKINDRSR